MSVKAGYEIGRDVHGLTANERAVLKGLADGKNLSATGHDMELSRQRTAKLASALVEKGWLIRGEKRGQYAIETSKISVIASW